MLHFVQGTLLHFMDNIIYQINNYYALEPRNGFVIV